MSESKKEKPENNVVFVGKINQWNPKKEAYERVFRPVPEYVQIVREKIQLPKDAQPGKAFYSEHADKLIFSSPDFLPIDSAEQPETDLPNDFPMRDVLRGLALNLAEIKTLDREGLIALKGIREKSADKILAYLETLPKVEISTEENEGEENNNG